MRRTLLALALLSVLTAPLQAQVGASMPGLEGLDQLLSVVEARYRAAPDPSDVWAQARRLEHDPERIRSFVRDEIAYEPYPGQMRGAAGALFARAGNALDQALLLTRLLAASGIEARVVGRDLDAEEGALLVEAFVRLAAPPAPAPPQQIERTAADLGADVETVRAVVRERVRREAALMEEVLEGSEREARRLSELIYAQLTPATVGVPARHYWVEVDGHAFDPTGSGVTLEGGRPVRDAELEAARTILTFRLVLERDVDGDIEARQLLSVALPADELAFRPVDVVVYPEPGELPSATEFLTMTTAERADALRGVGTFRSGLLVDGRTYGGAPFDLEGNVFEVAGDGRVAAATGVGGSVGGLFGGGLGGRPQPAASLHALRLELEVAGPGGATRLHTRTLYAAGDASFPLLRDSFLVETHLLPAREADRRRLGVLAHNAPGIRELWFGADPGRTIEPESELAPLLLDFADARRRLLSELGAAPLYEGVGIVRESRQVLLHPDAERAELRHAIDLMDTRLAFVGADGTYDQATGLRVGVAETALEWLLLLRADPGRVDADRSAWTLMGRARLQGQAPSSTALDGELRVRWSDDAWWSVDARTGLAVGRAEGGAGQGMVEYAWKASDSICTAMSPYFSVLDELDVESATMSDIEKVCSLRSIVGGLGSDIETLLDDDGALDLMEEKLGELGDVSDLTDVQQKLFDYIQAQTRSMWRTSASALGGL